VPIGFLVPVRSGDGLQGKLPVDHRAKYSALDAINEIINSFTKGGGLAHQLKHGVCVNREPFRQCREQGKARFTRKGAINEDLPAGRHLPTFVGTSAICPLDQSRTLHTAHRSPAPAFVFSPFSVPPFRSSSIVYYMGRVTANILCQARVRTAQT
jgi:hypothetical protein